MHVHIVEQDQVDAPLASRVGTNVGLNRAGREERPLTALDRKIDRRKGQDLLLPALLEQLEIGNRETGNAITGGIGDEGVDLDEVGFRAKDNRRRVDGSRRLGRSLLCDEGGDAEGGHCRPKHSIRQA